DHVTASLPTAMYTLSLHDARPISRVRATAGDLVQFSEVISGGSYLSQNDLRIHFGLGDHESVDKAKVFWPDGSVETLTNLIADRSEEHTSELQSLRHLVCRLLLEK